MKKKPLSFLMFFCILMFLGICRLDASASETLKKVSYTTNTFIADEWIDVKITPNLSLPYNWTGDTNKYKVATTITPVYNSVTLTYLNFDDEVDNVTITDSQKLKQINKKTDIVCFTKYTQLSPVYGNDGLINSFSNTISSVTADDLKDFSFEVDLPDSGDLELIFKDLDEVEEIYEVQYSVKFKVTASVILESGQSLSVKLSKTSVSGYINDIYYLTGFVANQQGNYKIVKAKSSNSAVAAVSVSTGRIRLRRVGTCTITLTNGYGRSASFKVKVNPSTIKRRRTSVSCILGGEMDLDTQGVVSILGTPKYTVKSSNSSIVSVRKSGNHPIIRGKKIGSAVLSFTYGKTKFSVRVNVVKANIVFASSATITKGSSRTLSAEASSNGLYIKKATSLNGLLSLKLSANARSLTLTANKSFSGTSVTDKVIVTFNNGTSKTITVKITQPKAFSLKDVKITLKRSYWNGSKACMEYTITNNSSKDLTKLRIFYTGTLNEEISGYTNISTSLPRGTSKTFITRVTAFDYLEGVTLKLVSAS